MRVLIIEDELPAARQLSKLLQAHLPAFNLLETLDSVESSVRWFNLNPAPDLIFMDIQIADGLSFDLFKQVKITSPVVFTTAFDQYAVQAFKVNAMDYLLKPIDPEDLVRALEKVHAQHLSPVIPDWSRFLQHFEKRAHKDRFLVKAGQHFVMLSIEDIAFFKSSDGLTQAFTHQGKKHFIEYPLDELEGLIDPAAYFRISRSMLTSIKAIKAIHPHLNGRLKLEVLPVNSEEVFVSRERVADFKGWLGG